MRTILLTTIAALGIVLAAIPQQAPVPHTVPAAVSTSYRMAHVAEPGSRGSVVDI